MRHIWCGVEQSMDAVTAVALHDAVTMSLNVLLNDVADFAIPFAWLHNGNGLLQCLVRNFHQILVFLRHISHEERLIQIAMKATMIDGDINVAQISILREKNGQTLISRIQNQIKSY